MPGGAIIKQDKKDYIYERAGFGGTTHPPLFPIGRLDQIKQSRLAAVPLFQSRFPSCVACSVTWLNVYNSVFKSGNQVNLSWPFLYKMVEHYPGGTIPQDILKVLQDVGQCEDQDIPQSKYWDAEDFFMEGKNEITEEISLRAGKYKIENSYFFLGETKEALVDQALVEDPVMIGIWLDPSTWTDQGVNRPGARVLLHALILVDKDPDGNRLCISFDKKDQLDVRVLSPDYPIEIACVLRDLPDYVHKPTIRRGSWFVRLLRKLCLS